jgi:murein DD-endopeptidase MepM/ murein hydrolase activator NlpD
MHKFYLFLGILLTPLCQHAQTFEPSAPLDIPLYLSGTFAELRANHFHGGIDIKTQGRSGLTVRSVADGYVSRIAVSPYGYGNALYIAHPEGYTTVYGHLNAFAPELEKWVEDEMKDRSKNDGNFYPSASQFPVKRGQMVAMSGNTGGSMGPHLHFEIRDSGSEEPLNPLEFGLKVLDTKKPNIKGLRWTSADFASSGVITIGDTLKIGTAAGIDLYTTDQQDGTTNNNGVYEIIASIAGAPFFEAHYRRINFNTTRFINAHVNYEQYYKEGVRYTRLYELDNNPLALTVTPEITGPAVRASRGWITVAQDSVVKVEVAIKDYSGNTSTLAFYVKGQAPTAAVNEGKWLTWDEDHVLEEGPVHVFIPAGALYRDTEFGIHPFAQGQYIIGAGNPLQKYMTLTWDLDSAQRMKSGYFLWELGRKGSKSAILGKREGDQLVFETRSTGTYYLDQDLQKPTVRLVQSTPMARSNSQFREIRLTASDDKTGIDRYSARIDGEFVRIDFDYKRNLLNVILNTEVSAGSHNLRVTVIDGVGNTTVNDYNITL